jgi:hypothetical protein
MKNCKVEKIWWGNTDNIWKPISEIYFDSFELAKEFIDAEKKWMFSYMHRYNISLKIENY